MTHERTDSETRKNASEEVILCIFGDVFADNETFNWISIFSDLYQFIEKWDFINYLRTVDFHDY